MRSLSDYGIIIPWGTSGEVRTACPQCSPGRGKQYDTCLKVNVEKGIWKCYYCGWKGGLGSCQGIPEAPYVSRSPLPDARKAAQLRQRWQEARAITPDDPAARYLRQRGILPADMPASLRFHPRLPYWHDGTRLATYPALLAAVQSLTGDLVNIHRTYLTPDGHKANVPSPKKLMTPAVRGATAGAAVRLDPPGETLAVAEGIETALAVRQCTDLPTWATIGTGGMQLLTVPALARIVIICADNDRNGAGQKAAQTLARRMLAERRRVKMLLPNTPGTDWADGVATREVIHA